MTDTRRDFLKKAALLTGSAGMMNALPFSIQKALAITPDPGTTFLDAEYVVLLMQENRSFDHSFGTLRGVRGYNDPRAITLPDKNPVWFQPDKNGKLTVPFRLDIKDTKATWMGDIPHSWENQVDARNEGKYNGWIEAKRPGNPEFREVPLTMGYYTREDIPFYYALADAFTVCDQHFCAALTGTTTNRSYFWTGKTHESGEKARVRNDELNYRHEGNWGTFPERLEDHGISWKVYQNEISLPTLVDDSSLLSNFSDNNLEWFTQYGTRYSAAYQAYLGKRKADLPGEIAKLEKQLSEPGASTEDLTKQIQKKQKEQEQTLELLERWTPEKFQQLSARAQALHQKAFATNSGDPDYHKSETMTYMDGGEERNTSIPKGDILYQFRKDVKEGALPTVSWVVAPQKFSDHPSAPWYGAWYVSEVLDILTQNPEVWKKTIFILNYDENDGYFDHIPPFVAPDPNDPSKGKASAGLDVTGEFVTREEEIKAGFKEKDARTSPVGLGYRVPLVIASPWSRGGWVNSEVCDITSTIMFLETFLQKKTGKDITEPNISAWRREMSGDLTSSFRPYNGEPIDMPEWVNRNQHMQKIYNAKFKELPNNFVKLSATDAAKGKSLLPAQEPGTKPSNALCYDLHADGQLSADGQYFEISMKAGKALFKEKSLGAPFNVYAPGKYMDAASGQMESVKTWAFAVKAGDTITYQWPLADFEGGRYHLRVYGPNGFYREFAGDPSSTIRVSCLPQKSRKKSEELLQVAVTNFGSQPIELKLADQTYHQMDKSFQLKAGASKEVLVDLAKYQGWYDLSIYAGDALLARYAGRQENGTDRISDPFMGRMI